MQNAAEFINKIYPEHPKPLYLSQLGAILVISGLKPSQNHRFKTSQSWHNTQFCASEFATCRFSSSTPR